MALSKITWTDWLWSVTTGCTPCSLGCENCYARTTSLRLQGRGIPTFRNGFVPTEHPELLDEPRDLEDGMKVFVSGFSDLLHPAFSDDFIRRAFDVMVECPRVDFTVLTKRAERLAALAPTLPWPDNIIVGVTVESDAQSERVDHLRKVPARRRLISWEPALGSLEKTSLEGIHWVIAGCEKVGCWPKRPMDIEWVRDLRDRCQAEGIAFYFKQAAVGRKVVQHPELDGVVWEEFPE